MRTSPLRSFLSEAGAKFEQRLGVEIVSSISDTKTEYYRIRDAVGITDFSHIQRFRIPETAALDILDGLVAGNAVKTRFGRMTHTLIADDDGMIAADCYIANNDDEFILLCESIISDEALSAILARASDEAQIENLCDTHALISVDGYKAWAAMKELFGANILGLPYLSVEMHPFNGVDIRLFRAGKTSEFGYLLMPPVDMAEDLAAALDKAAAKQGGGFCGLNIHNDLRLEGRFFNIFAEGLTVRDPLPLGLQWMIDFEKERFSGREALIARRSAGSKTKIIGITSTSELKTGQKLFDGNDEVATIVAVSFSYVLNQYAGLAIFPTDIAFAGLEYTLGGQQGALVKSISMPPIMPKSLTVKLDEM